LGEDVLNNEQFESLASPLLDPLYNFACWLCGDKDEASDVVQESFAKALKAFSGFQPGTNFRAWMFKIVRNTFLTSRTSLEHRSTVQEEESLDAAVTRETPESLFIRRADTELVQSAIASLSLSFREVVLLVDIEDMKYQEVSDALGIPIGTVMSRLARARKQMRAFIVERLGVKT
jgi:RNA polymerase sigma-70 factor (ECF subfamily)